MDREIVVTHSSARCDRLESSLGSRSSLDGDVDR